MRRRWQRGLFVAVALATIAASGWGDATANQPATVTAPVGSTRIIAIEGEIDLGLAAFVERVLAGAGPGDTVILEINTFGGAVDAGVRIRDALLDSKAQTVAFVNKRAISAGALIALATDTIVMTSGGTIGAVTPVQLEGPPGHERMGPVEAKVVSYMRKEMKATAEARKRRGDVAEAMVDGAVRIDGFADREGPLTLTTDEALRLKVAAYRADSVAELCAWLRVPEPPLLRPAPNWAERMARFLSDPAIASLLMTLGMLGILIELWHPGHVVSGLVGIICLGLFFFGHYVVHLAGWGAIMLFVFGVAMVLFEVFFFTGHGAVAAVGIIAIVASLTMSLLGVETIPLDVSWSLGQVTRAVVRVLGSVMATGLLMMLAVRFLPRTRVGRSLVLETVNSANAGASSAQAGESLLGLVGESDTPLRPAGKMRAGERHLDVVTEGGFLEAGTKVVVVAVDGSRVVVRPLG